MLIDLLSANQASVIDAFDALRSDEDTAFDLALPEVISDPDGDALSVNVTRAGGTALPAWLMFDAATARLSGTPPADFAGTLALQVTANDGVLATTRAFDLVIDPVNDAPVLAAPLSDRMAVEDTAFDIRLTQGIYSDPDGDDLQFALVADDGSAAPDWITFDADTLMLTGQAPQDFYGDVALRLQISDGQITISDDFALLVQGTQDAPVQDATLPDVTIDADGNPITGGAAFTFAARIGNFRGPDGDPLVFASRLATGTALPDWLTFDGTGYSGTPPTGARQVIEIELVAGDGLDTMSGTFALTVLGSNAGPVAMADSFAISVPDILRLDQSALLVNDSDADGDTLVVTAVGEAANGQVSLENGVISYLADFDHQGPD